MLIWFPFSSPINISSLFSRQLLSSFIPPSKPLSSTLSLSRALHFDDFFKQCEKREKARENEIFTTSQTSTLSPGLLAIVKIWKCRSIIKSTLFFTVFLYHNRISKKYIFKFFHTFHSILDSPSCLCQLCSYQLPPSYLMHTGNKTDTISDGINTIFIDSLIPKR